MLTERICGQWVHKESGRSYHSKHAQSQSLTPAGVEAVPDAANMLDDETRAPLVQQTGDTKEALLKRVESYHS